MFLIDNVSSVCFQTTYHPYIFGKNRIKFQPTNVDEDFDELETDRFNDEYDRNSDGYLTGDELLFWVSLKFKKI